MKFLTLFSLNVQTHSFTIFSCRRSRADLVVSITILVLVVLVLKHLPLLSQLKLLRTFKLSVEFSLWNTIHFRAFCPSRHYALLGTLPSWAPFPSRHFANLDFQHIWALCLSRQCSIWGTLPFKILWPSAHFALKGSDSLENLSFWAFCTFGLFAL